MSQNRSPEAGLWLINMESRRVYGKVLMVGKQEIIYRGIVGGSPVKIKLREIGEKGHACVTDHELRGLGMPPAQTAA